MGCNYGLFRALKMPAPARRLPRSARHLGEGNLETVALRPPLRGGDELLFLFLR
jgi:hypothetical protein